MGSFSAALAKVGRARPVTLSSENIPEDGNKRGRRVKFNHDRSRDSLESSAVLISCLCRYCPPLVLLFPGEQDSGIRINDWQAER